MKLEKGIILKTIDYQENSKIIYIMTCSGLKSAIVRGAKNYKSKTFAYSQPITLIEFSMQKEKYIEACNVLNYFNNIKLDNSRLISTLKIIEISYLLGEHITDYEIFFNFLNDILIAINEDKETYLYYELIFKTKTLYLLGVAPVFNKCVTCGTRNNIIGFSFNSGGMKCKKCYKTDNFIYPTDTVNDIKEMYLIKLPNLKEDINNKKIVYNYEKANRFLTLYYQQYLGFTSNIKTQ